MSKYTLLEEIFQNKVTFRKESFMMSPLLSQDMPFGSNCIQSPRSWPYIHSVATNQIHNCSWCVTELCWQIPSEWTEFDEVKFCWTRHTKCQCKLCLKKFVRTKWRLAKKVPWWVLSCWNICLLDPIASNCLLQHRCYKHPLLICIEDNVLNVSC